MVLHRDRADPIPDSGFGKHARGDENERRDVNKPKFGGPLDLQCPTLCVLKYCGVKFVKC
eukprot:399919-Amphidinium_carterae.1